MIEKNHQYKLKFENPTNIEGERNTSIDATFTILLEDTYVFRGVIKYKEPLDISISLKGKETLTSKDGLIKIPLDAKILGRVLRKNSNLSLEENL